jgi:hypothetical protein
VLLRRAHGILVTALGRDLPARAAFHGVVGPSIIAALAEPAAC